MEGCSGAHLYGGVTVDVYVGQVVGQAGGVEWTWRRRKELMDAVRSVDLIGGCFLVWIRALERVRGEYQC